jgi:hypothetical protein
MSIFSRIGGRTGVRANGSAWLSLACVLALSVIVGACANVGRDFPDSRVPEILIGKTTQAQVEQMFGKPWRVGLEDGQRTWTYGKYRYSLFGQSNTKDLVIRFNDKDVVVSYSFNTTDHKK